MSDGCSGISKTEYLFTNLVSSIYEGGAPKVLENAEGARTTPSVVAFTKGEFSERRRI